MIPNFVYHSDAPGPYSFLLPPGMHPCTLPDVEEAMVKPFGTSQTRGRIFNGLSRYLADCQTHGISGRIWLDGSFVTGKNDPGDVDVISLVSADLIRRLDAADQTFALHTLKGGEATKPQYDVHSFAVVSVPKSHAAYLAQAQEIAKWINFFRRTKEFVALNGGVTRRPKGILQLDFGQDSEVRAIAQWFEEIKKEGTL